MGRPPESSFQGEATGSPTNGEPVRHSTGPMVRLAEASCRSPANPKAVFQPWGISWSPRSYAMCAIPRTRLSSPAFGDVRLDDIERTRLTPGRE